MAVERVFPEGEIRSLNPLRRASLDSEPSTIRRLMLIKHRFCPSSICAIVSEWAWNQILRLRTVRGTVKRIRECRIYGTIRIRELAEITRP